MLLALLPSRETPQATRSSSSGTQRPKCASTIASAAAPHSSAFSCRIVVVLPRFMRILRQQHPEWACLAEEEPCVARGLTGDPEGGPPSGRPFPAAHGSGVGDQLHVDRNQETRAGHRARLP